MTVKPLFFSARSGCIQTAVAVWGLALIANNAPHPVIRRAVAASKQCLGPPIDRLHAFTRVMLCD